MLNYILELVNLREECFEEYKKNNRELRYNDKKFSDVMSLVLDKKQYDIFNKHFDGLKQSRLVYNMMQMRNVRKMVKVLRMIERRRW